MQRHQSSLCTPLHGAFGSARPYQVVDILPGGGSCPSLPANGLRAIERAVARTARPLIARVVPVVTPVLRTLIRPVGIALYVALAIVAMALLLRMSGVSTSPSFSLVEMTWSSQASESREAELDQQAQRILSALTGDTTRAATGQ
jgi:hypothetical protein